MDLIQRYGPLGSDPILVGRPFAEPGIYDQTVKGWRLDASAGDWRTAAAAGDWRTPASVGDWRLPEDC